MRHFRTLDWLRAFAILLVLFSHWLSTFSWKEHPYYSWLGSVNSSILDFLQVPATMHLGVIIFIVLSGFLIHFPNSIKKYEDSEFVINPRSFIKRRFFRIYSALAEHLLVFKRSIIIRHIDFSLLFMMFLLFVLINNLYLGANQYIDKIGVIYFGIVVAVLILNFAKSDYLNSSSIISSSISRMLIFVAMISYSVYLTHVPVMDAITRMLSSNGVGMTPAVHLFLLLSILCCSYVYYKLIEKPSHMKAVKF